MTDSSSTIIDVLKQIDESITSCSAVPTESIRVLTLSLTSSDISLDDSTPILTRFFAILNALLSLDDNDLDKVDPTNSLSDLAFKVCSLLPMARILDFFPQPQWLAILNTPPGSPVHKLLVSILCKHLQDPHLKQLIDESHCSSKFIQSFLTDPSPTIIYLQQIIVATILESKLTDPHLLDLYRSLWNGDFSQRSVATLVARLLDLAISLMTFCIKHGCAPLFPTLFFSSPPGLKDVWTDDPLLAVAFVQFYQNIVIATQSAKSQITEQIINGFASQLQSIINVYVDLDVDDFVRSSIVDLISALSSDKSVRPLALKLVANSRILEKRDHGHPTHEDIKLYSIVNPDFLLDSHCEIIYEDLCLTDERYLSILLNFISSAKAFEYLAPLYLSANHLCGLSRDISMAILGRLVQSKYGREYMYLRIPEAMAALVVSCESDLNNSSIWNQKLQILQALRDESCPIPELWEGKVETAYKYMILGGSLGAVPQVKSVAL